MAPSVVTAGVPVADARVAAVVLHGRGQDPGYMLEHLVARLDLPDVAYLLPAAPGGSWYPQRFSSPRKANEPWLGQALEACGAAIARLEADGLGVECVVLAGFSQGACLAAEYLARRPECYAGAALLTGALIGPEDDVTEVAPQGGMPLFMASSRHDEWVPLERVEATAAAFAAAGAEVDLRLSDDREHRIGPEAVAGVRRLLTEFA